MSISCLSIKQLIIVSYAEFSRKQTVSQKVRGSFPKDLHHAFENVSVFIMAIFMHTSVLQVLHLGTVLTPLGMFGCVLPSRLCSHSSSVNTKAAACGFGKICF